MAARASTAKTKVSLVKAGDDLVAAVDAALCACGMGDCVGPGSRVLVKPNMHGGDGWTASGVMEATCRWAFAKGARKVLLGDGPFWGLMDTGPYFERTGLLAACAATGAEVADMHHYPYKLYHPGDPELPEVIGISRYLHEVDVVINLPLMKTHFHTGITIALKNVKGCLRPVDKRRMHERELSVALAAMNVVIKPLITVNLCDATVAGEGFGPGSSTPVPLGLLLASVDPVALDTVCCQLMEWDPRQLALIRNCAQRGVGTDDPRHITVVGEKVADHSRRFERPQEALARQFPGLTILSERACSVCGQNLSLALQQVQKSGRDLGGMTVLIGAGPQSEADVLVGNCALKDQTQGRRVPGCPPSVGAIRDALLEE